MKVVAKFGYNSVVFPSDVNAGQLIDAFSRGIVCNQQYVGNTLAYIRDDNQEIEIKIVQDDDIRLPESDNTMKPLLDKIAELSSQLSTEKTNSYKLKAELDTINKKLSEISAK